MNVVRMKRYIARTTPDRIVRHFDLLSDNLRYDQEMFLKWFTDRMTTKYGPGVIIDIYIDDMLGIHPSDVSVVVRARPTKGRTTIVNTTPTPGRSPREPS